MTTIINDDYNDDDVILIKMMLEKKNDINDNDDKFNCNIHKDTDVDLETKDITQITKRIEYTHEKKIRGNLSSLLLPIS